MKDKRLTDAKNFTDGIISSAKEIRKSLKLYEGALEGGHELNRYAKRIVLDKVENIETMINAIRKVVNEL